MDKPVDFGVLGSEKLEKLNKIRDETGVALIENGSLLVHPRVQEHLRVKRMGLDGMRAKKVADLLFSAVHNRSSCVLRTRHPHIQVLVKFNRDGKTANVAYIGEHQSKGSVKTTYIKSLRDINKDALEGGDLPSSVRPLKGLTRSSAEISDFQNDVNKGIISKKA